MDESADRRSNPSVTSPRMRVNGVCEDFESGWKSGGRPDIQTYLKRASSDPSIPISELTVELVLVDMEYRWRAAADRTLAMPTDGGTDTSVGLPDRPFIEDYLRLLPQFLTEKQSLEELISGEYRIRRRCGDRATSDEYIRRFPAFAQRVGALLKEIDSSIGDGDSGPRCSIPTRFRENVPAELAAFVEELHAAGIVSREDVLAAWNVLPPEGRPGTTDELGSWLVADGRLTAYQWEAIRGGRTASLRLGRYVISDRIGAGGMGEVLKARDTVMERTVAIKVLPNRGLISSQAVDRFRREVQAAARLNHANIVTAYDAGEHQGTHYLVMEYVDGDDLAQLVNRCGPLPLEQAIDCTVQAARGLEYAHQRGVIHRDIKPGNLLLDLAGTVKILDMGLARLLDTPGNRQQNAESLTNSGQMMGTCDYMAPEQADDTHHVDHRADIYSLGCTLYRLVTGRPPYSGKSYINVLLAHRESPVPSLRVVRIDAPAEMDAVFQKMVAKSPDDRYQSMREVIGALDRCPRGASPSEPLPAIPADPFPINGARPREPQRCAVTVTEPKAASERPIATHGEEEALARQTGPTKPLVAGAMGTLGRIMVFLGIRRGLGENAKYRWLRLAMTSTAALLLTGAAIYLAITSAGTFPAGTGVPAVTTVQSPSLATSPFDAVEAKEYQQRWAEYLGVPVEFTNSIGMKFVLIPPGEFEMGWSAAEIEEVVQTETPKETAKENVSYFADRVRSEGPRTRVRITKAFYLSACETTQREYLAIMGENPSQFSPTGKEKDRVSGKDSGRFPVERVVWEECVKFCERLTAMPAELSEKRHYRLPTEAQWEYACRAGTVGRFHFGNDDNQLRNNDWYYENSEFMSHPVGEKTPNPWGLYDMHGNVSEWCADAIPDYGAGVAMEDPEQVPIDSRRTWRGGNFTKRAGWCRSAFRVVGAKAEPLIETGFRIACEIPAAEVSIRASQQEMLEVGAPLSRPSSVTLKITPSPREFKTGEPLSEQALVISPAPIRGVRSWTIETVGHRGGVGPLAYSPDGRALATGGNDGTIRIWDVESRKLRRALVGHDWPVRSLSWSPDGKLLASASSWQETVLIWQVDSGAVLRAIPAGLPATDKPVAFSPDGRFLAVGQQDGAIAISDLSDPEPIKGRRVLRGHVGSVSSLAWSPDGGGLVSGGYVDRTVCFWDMGSGRLLRKRTGPSANVAGCCGLAWSPDGRFVASAHTGSDGGVAIWDATDGQVRRSYPDGGYASLAWSRDGSRLAALSEDRFRLVVWRTTEGTPLWEVREPLGVWGIAYSPDGNVVAVPTRRGVAFLNAESGDHLNELPGNDGYECPRRVLIDPARGSLLSSGCSEPTGQTLSIVDLDSGVRRGRIDFQGYLGSACWSPDQSTFAVAEVGHGISIYARPNISLLTTIVCKPEGQIAWSSDGKMIAWSGRDGGGVWDVLSKQQRCALPGGTGGVTFSPDGSHVAIAIDGEVKVCETKMGKTTNGFTGTRGTGMSALAWSPDGETLVAAHNSGLYLWSAKAPGPPKDVKIPGISSRPEPILAFLDNSALAIGNMRSVCIWDMKTAKPLRMIPGHGTWGDQPSLFGDLLAFPGQSIVRLRRLSDGQLLRTLVSLRNDQSAVFSPEGHFRGTPGAEKELVYVVQTDSVQETLTPEDFTQKYGWKNEPERIGPGAAHR